MLFADLATASAAVGATRSRLAKRALLAAAIRTADPDEIDLVVTYLSGTLRQRRTGVGWSSLSSLPSAAAEPTLTVRAVDDAFAGIAAIGGAGSAALRAGAVEALFARATEGEQRLLRGLVFDEIRQGALDSLVQDGLAEAFGVPAAAVQRASMLLGSTAAAARRLVADGLDGLTSVGLQVGVPVRPMLAAAAPDPAAAVEKSGLPALVDTKLDGIRVQVHRDGDRIRLYTRSLDDITDRLPDIVTAVASLPARQLVLDGEVLAVDAAGRPVPFQQIAARTATKAAEPSAAGAPLPLTLFCFDLLHVDGRDLLDEPLVERAEVMRAVLPAELIVPRTVAPDLAAVEAAFAGAVRAGFEGAVVKKLHAPYAAGRRDSGWIKLKPRHTFDLAVIAAEWGYGRRTGWLSNLHLAARDPRTGELVMLGKTFKGLTDAMLTWQTEQFLAREARRTKTTVYVDPPLVAEIAIDGVQASTRYPGGVALRFARVLRYRDDKSVDEVDGLDAIVALGPAAAVPDPA
ncbi:ATP-dependent DNA ligase [Nakamurella sp.]|uniref:ATP-dependent DNA ligase n=1 Tax=Nakamurella sp. TaxID=1869182 RepID=UPI003B3A1662